jgi:hypothetical protein
MSTHRPVLLLGHTESSSEVAATVRVVSTLAGDKAHESPSLLPVKRVVVSPSHGDRTMRTGLHSVHYSPSIGMPKRCQLPAAVTTET